MREYDRVKYELESFLETAIGEDYDAVYYYIGERDFDQTDALSLEFVADLILEKITKQKPNPYLGSGLADTDEVLFSVVDGAPENIRSKIADREKRKEAAAERHAIYIPDSSRFRKFIETAILVGMDSPEYDDKFFIIPWYIETWEKCCDFVRNATDEDYDAIYYFIHKKDFDQTNGAVIEAVVDLLFERIAPDGVIQYISRRSIDTEKAFYEDGLSAPDNVMIQVNRRKQKIESPQFRWHGYVPDSEKFMDLLFDIRVKCNYTGKQERLRKASEPYYNSLSYRAERYIGNKVEEAGGCGVVFGSIYLAFLGFCLLYALFNV